MRIILSFFIAVILAASFGIWKLTSNTQALNKRIENTQSIVSALKAESTKLDRYEDGVGLSLAKFYLEVFNVIREVSFYHHADSEIKIIEAKDLVSIEDLFKPSVYRGIRYVDILCRIGVKDSLDTNLFEVLHKIIKTKPIEILDLRIEKGVLSLTMRLYGP